MNSEYTLKTSYEADEAELLFFQAEHNRGSYRSRGEFKPRLAHLGAGAWSSFGPAELMTVNLSF